MTAQEALNLIEPVPAEDFITGVLTNEKNKCCVAGHIVRLMSEDPSDYSWRNICWGNNKQHIRDLVVEKGSEFLSEEHTIYGTSGLVTVNNNDDINGYNEPEIKDRVVHMLKDMIKAGY